MYQPKVTRANLIVEALENRLVPSATSFVTSLYTNLLLRAPDQAGLANWVAALNAGVTPQQVATAIWDSPEHRAVEVTGYYQTFLGRQPDAAGLAGWVSLMESGVLNEQGVEIGFLTSQEYINEHPSQLAYISGLYTSLLGRLPSVDEVDIWVPILQVNGDVFVTSAIVTSNERFLDVIDVYYLTYLNRSPDPVGAATWLNALDSGATVEQVAEAILGSAEYVRDH
jgi:hypothetical protein